MSTPRASQDTGLATRLLAEAERLYAAGEVWKRNPVYTAGSSLEQFMVVAANNMLMPAVLDQSALVWIAAPMVELLLHAAPTMPLFNFSRTLLPWSDAVCFVERPLLTVQHPVTHEDVDVSAIQWAEHWAAPASGPNETVMLAGHGRVHGRFLSPILMSNMRDGMDWAMHGTPIRVQTTPSMTTPTQSESMQVGGLMAALWTLIQQRVAVHRLLQPDRAAARRWKRDRETDPPLVVLIQLRRPAAAGSEPMNPAAEIDWSHRWMVDGHWRQHWYPKSQQHRPIWIAPHVKGPADKPLVLKEKLYAWTR